MLSKILLVFLLLGGVVSCSNLKQDEDVAFGLHWNNGDEDRNKISEQLRGSLASYWYNRYSRNYVQSYLAELPEVQGRVSEDLYVAYYGKSYPIERVEVLSLQLISDDQVAFRIGLTVVRKQGEEKVVTVLDRWQLVEGQWRHKLSDRLLLGE